MPLRLKTSPPNFYTGPGLPTQTTCYPFLKSNEELITDSIVTILSTDIGERLFEPEFGCALRKYVFEQNDTILVTLVRDAIATAITRWEPRVSIKSLVVKAEEHTLTINLYLLIKKLNTVFTVPLELERELRTSPRIF